MTGLLFAIHGYQKFASGIGGVATFFAKISIPFPGLMAPFIAILELVGGILLILGVGTRVLGALFGVEVLVTTLWVKIPARAGTRVIWIACCSSPAFSWSLRVPGLRRSTGFGGNSRKRGYDDMPSS